MSIVAHGIVQNAKAHCRFQGSETAWGPEHVTFFKTWRQPLPNQSVQPALRTISPTTWWIPAISHIQVSFEVRAGHALCAFLHFLDAHFQPLPHTAVTHRKRPCSTCFTMNCGRKWNKEDFARTCRACASMCDLLPSCCWIHLFGASCNTLRVALSLHWCVLLCLHCALWNIYRPYGFQWALRLQNFKRYLVHVESSQRMWVPIPHTGPQHFELVERWLGPAHNPLSLDDGTNITIFKTSLFLYLRHMRFITQERFRAGFAELSWDIFWPPPAGGHPNKSTKSNRVSGFAKDFLGLPEVTGAQESLNSSARLFFSDLWINSPDVFFLNLIINSPDDFIGFINSEDDFFFGIKKGAKDFSLFNSHFLAVWPKREPERVRFLFLATDYSPTGLGQSGISCRMAACPQSQRRKFCSFFRKLGIQRVQGTLHVFWVKAEVCWTSESATN